MTAPNLLTVSTITGVTTAVGLTTTATTTFLSNPQSSNKLFKVNTLMVVNNDGVSSADITVRYHLAAAGAGTSVPLAWTVTVPADASFLVIAKDNPIYLEENRSLTGTASTANALSIVCSYEDIS